MLLAVLRLSTIIVTGFEVLVRLGVASAKALTAIKRKVSRAKETAQRPQDGLQVHCNV